ncbi:hypothetical protein B0T17DRAFT_494826 [Bombardia bombarda]|uniref:Nonsense-mediated mRNA decay factor n=1 Tax=Bombardia bombarda TaxID=252184 RepID=A0AA39WTP4_9PEZI|nr:hypothetical protein B0T17DRAFT_494826 [Bombardia bombarda]
MATTGAMAPTADDLWKQAQKVRLAIVKELDHIQHGGPGANETVRFEKVEKLMENYRLHCVGTIWADIRAANDKHVEDILWQVHSNVSKAYRVVIARLQGSDHVVLKRKVEKLYLSYIKTTQYFYKGYLQRVCARYNMKELRRIARLAELEDMSVPDQDRVDAAAEGLEEIVALSCQQTLVSLGDLARYRTLIRTKDRRWDTALTYYALANELVPESGYGHHQCSVVYLETENHLEVVYHLYRAMACDKPHPNAAHNLKRAFRDPQSRRTRSIRGTNDALISWFIKLHASYYKGKEFPGRKELEDEVDHRLSMAMKSGTNPDIDMGLLKMVLINITAYVVSKEKIDAEWTDDGSRSCQFILSLNIRTIHTIARLLREELQELVQRESTTSASETPQEGESSNYPSAFHRILPLLRVYMVWLCFYGSDLVDFKDHLEPQFGNMCRTLGQTLTLLYELLSKELDSDAIVPWRFPEDEETLGINCLAGPNLDGRQLHYHPITKKPKSRAEDSPDLTFTANLISLTRGYSIMGSAFDLAEKSKFPFMILKAKKQPRELTVFVYTEGGKPEPTSYQSPHQSPIPADQTNTVALHTPATVPVTVQKFPAQVSAGSPPNDSEGFSDDDQFYVAPVEKAGGAVSPREVGVSGPTEVALVAGFSGIENQLFKILDGFLVPPEIPKHNPVSEAKVDAHGQDKTSYGMGSTTAGEVFGSGAPTSPVSGSANAKAFPTLPWDYFYTPAPVDGNLRKSATGNAPNDWRTIYSLSVRPSTSGSAAAQPQGNGKMNQPFENHTGVQSQQWYGGIPPPGLTGQHGVSGQPWPSKTDRDYDDRVNQSLQGHLRTSSNVAQPTTWSSPAGQWQLGQHATKAHAAPTNSPFSFMAFSGNTSSLPQVNSPWGVPMKAQGGTYAHPSPSAVSGSSPLGAGSTYSGTMNHSPGIPYSNGSAYDDTMAHGRNGMTSPADRNYALGQAATGPYAAAANAAEEYQRRALMSAWVDDYRPAGMSATAGGAVPTGHTVVVDNNRRASYYQGENQSPVYTAGRPGSGSNSLKSAIQQKQAGARFDGKNKPTNIPRR